MIVKRNGAQAVSSCLSSKRDFDPFKQENMMKCDFVDLSSSHREIPIIYCFQ